MDLAKLPLYWRTLRHLKPVQFHGRLMHRLPRRAPIATTPPPLRARGQWEAPARREQSLLAPGRWRFLGETHEVSDPGGWDRAEIARLWRYNLHYFDDLNALGGEQRTDWHEAELVRWIEENAPVAGTGWEPYPTSLRIVNWIKWSLAGHALGGRALTSLAQQVHWLTRRIEWHLLGNHLFANAKALVFAGLFFDGPQAERWLDQGLNILTRELAEQVLDDGGHFERSTMYHALALEDALDLVNLGRCYAAEGAPLLEDLPATAQYMATWLQAMCHPDGEIAFFNDAALGIAPPTPELLDYARRLGVEAAPIPAPVLVLPDSGYARLRQGPACLLLDAAPVGPDYLPGHAHADTLSFELSVHGRRVLVNSGTSCYGVSDERLRQRGTAAHNTVVVQGHDSSEVWSGFRVGRRARVFDRHVDEAACSLQASHDGYRWLPGKPVHTRRWQLDERRLLVTDTVTPGAAHAEARFHLHPDIRPEGQHLRLPGGATVRWHAAAGAPRWEPATYHPRFGFSQPSQCLVVALHGGRGEVSFDWGPET